jgi:hypothetical protein
MTRAETYGHRFSLAVAEYLKVNSLLSLGKINARILADIAQQFHDNEKKVVKRKVQLASEEEWLKELEAEDVFKGIDIRRELGIAQSWCKDRQRICTRLFFKSWLIREAKQGKVSRNYDGATSKPAKPLPPKPRYTLDTPVPSWPLIIRTYGFQWDASQTDIEVWCSGDWNELPPYLREKIIQAA